MKYKKNYFSPELAQQIESLIPHTTKIKILQKKFLASFADTVQPPKCCIVLGVLK